MNQQKYQILTNKRVTYVIEEMIGSGTGGKVYKAQRDQNQRKELVALKLQNQLDWQEEQTLKILNENKQRLNHIVNVLDLDSYNNQIIIIMDLASGSFYEFWRNSQIFNVQEILHYFLQIVIGTQELHSLSLIHRDIKLENVVYMEINNQIHLKLCDTGLMRQVDGRKTITVGTPYYMSPEQINQTIYNEKVDIWSLGMILYEMLAKKTMVYGNSIQEILYKILNLKQEQINHQIDSLFISNQEYSQDIKILLKQMINVDSNQRVEAKVIATKLKQILKINVSQQSNDNQNSQIDSAFKEQIRQEMQKEFELKYKQEFEKVEEQHKQALKQIKDETEENYKQIMREEIIKTRRECEDNLRVQFELDLKNKEQQFQQEYTQKQIFLNDKQQQELKNSQAQEMLNYKKQMEQQLQQKVEQQIKQKEQIIQKDMDQQIQMQLQNKEQYLKLQLQEQLQKYYQQEFEQKSRNFVKFQNLFINTQQNIFKNQILIEDQLKQLQQQLQQQQNPSQKYLNYNQTFQKQLQDKLNQLQQINTQLIQFKIQDNQQLSQNSNQIEDYLKKLIQITNSSQGLLNIQTIGNFIKDINLQLNQINQDQDNLSIRYEQEQLQVLQYNSDILINKIKNIISNQEIKIGRLNTDFDFLIQIDNQLTQQWQSVNQQFYSIKVELKLIEDIMKITKQQQFQLNEVDKQNKQLSNLEEKLQKFEQILSFCKSKVSEQKEKDLQMILNDLENLINNIKNWEEKINYYNQKQQQNLQKGEQEILQELNKQLQTLIQIKFRIFAQINQLKQNQNKNSYKMFTSIKQEFEITTFKIDQVNNNYIQMQNQLQLQAIQQIQVIEEQKILKSYLKQQNQILKQDLNNLLNEYSNIQKICKDEANQQNMLIELEGKKKKFLNDYQMRIEQIDIQIVGFENTIFTNIEEVKLAQMKINFQIEFILQNLKSEFQSLNQIKQQKTEEIDNYLNQNFQFFQTTIKELINQCNSLFLNQTESQCFNEIENQKNEFQQKINDHKQQLDDNISKCYLSSQIDVLVQQKSNTDLKNQIDLLNKKEEIYIQLLSSQKERISNIENEVNQFKQQQMIQFVKKYQEDCNQIYQKVNCMQSKSMQLDKSQLKYQINEFNKSAEQYKEQIQKLQKTKQNNQSQFNNLQFYAKNLEILQSLDLLFQLYCFHKREIMYIEQKNKSQNSFLQKKKEELDFHKKSYDEIEKCFIQYFSQIKNLQDQMLIQSINNYLKLQNGSTEKYIEMKQFQDLNKKLEEYKSNLQTKVKQQNTVKVNYKIKFPSADPDKKSLFNSLKLAFDHYIPKLSGINIQVQIAFSQNKY